MIPSIFYNPDDDADARLSGHRTGDGKQEMPPRTKRVRDCITVAMLVRSVAHTDRARLRRMKAYIMGLRLPVSRLAGLWNNAHDEAVLYARPERSPLPITRAPIAGVTMPEYADAAWLVMRAALALLVNVPLADERDAEAFVDIVTTSGYVLPKRQQRRAVAIARRYVTCAIKDKPFTMGAAS